MIPELTRHIADYAGTAGIKRMLIGKGEASVFTYPLNGHSRRLIINDNHQFRVRYINLNDFHIPIPVMQTIEGIIVTP